MMTVKEFLDEYNYQCNGANEQSDEVLQELKSMVASMFNTYCGEVPNFEFIDKKGHIKLIDEKDI